MEYTTGLTDDEFDELLVQPREEGVEGRPPILSLSGSPRATLIYLRHNIVQTAIGELPGVLDHCFAGRQGPDGGDRSDPEGAAAHRRGGARELRLSWWTAPSSSAGADVTAAIRSRGERGRAGMSVRIPVLPAGGFVRAPGSMHDAAAPGAPGLLEGIDPSGWIASKGYVRRGMITLHKNLPNGELSEDVEKAYRSVNRIRQVVEQTITAALSLYVFKTIP